MDTCISKYTIIGDEELADLPSFTVFKIPDQKLMECLSPTDILDLIEAKSTSMENDEEGYHIAENNRLHLFHYDEEEKKSPKVAKMPIFKLPNSGVHVIALPTLLLRYRFFILEKLGKFRIGTYFGVSRTHGSEEILYTPIPVNENNINIDLDKEDMPILSIPNKEVFSRFPIEEFPLWKKARLELLNSLPLPERVVFKQPKSGILRGIITFFTEVSPQGAIIFDIDTIERRITGTEPFPSITRDELESKGFCANDISLEGKVSVILELIKAKNIDAICIKDDDELIALLNHPGISDPNDDTDDKKIEQLMMSNRARIMDVNFEKCINTIFLRINGMFMPKSQKFNAILYNNSIFEYLLSSENASQIFSLLDVHFSLYDSKESIHQRARIIEKIKTFPSYKVELATILWKHDDIFSNALLRELTYEDVMEEKDPRLVGEITKDLLLFGRLDLATRIIESSGESELLFYYGFFNLQGRTNSIKLTGDLIKELIFLLKIGKIGAIKYILKSSHIITYLNILFGRKKQLTEEEREYIESKYDDIVRVLPMEQIVGAILEKPNIEYPDQSYTDILEIMLKNKKIPSQFLKTLLKELKKHADGEKMVCKLLKTKRSKFEPVIIEESLKECEEKAPRHD